MKHVQWRLLFIDAKTFMSIYKNTNRVTIKQECTFKFLTNVNVVISIVTHKDIFH